MEEENIEVSEEIEETETDFESANLAKWMWVAIGAAVAGGIGGAVMFVRNKLSKKNDVEVSIEDIEITVEDFEEDSED